MKKHSQNKRIISLIAALIFFCTINGCKKEEPPKDYLAMVNGQPLTRKFLATRIDTSNLSKHELKEFIDNWIETELLAQEALKEGIEYEEDFIFQYHLNSRKLLAGKFLEKKFSDTDFLPSSKEIEEYFAKHKHEFVLDYNIYKVNQIVLSDLRKAVDLRNTAILKLDFKNAVNQIVKVSDILDLRYDVYLKDFDELPYELSEMMETMFTGEITYPIDLGNGKYLVTQLVEKYSRGTEPKLNFVKELITERIMQSKQQDYYKALVNKLADESDIQIKELD
ncbi:MAG: hypothetical protein FJ213_09215 [Ignavibacteria bacterium]|nr:hypothetical protein [Ignavibacteria bacterium]